MNCLLFDFDGTLADTREAIFITMKGTLEKLGRPPQAGIEASLLGLPLKDIFAKLSGVEDKAFIRECVKTYREDFPGNCAGIVRLFPGVRETLEILRERGDALAITSSRGRQSLLELVDMLELRRFFAVIVGEEDVERPKPAADAALLALAKLSMPRDAALAVGDTIYDIGMGQAAGVKTCAVTYGNQPASMLAQARPDFMISAFPQLLAMEIWNRESEVVKQPPEGNG